MVFTVRRRACRGPGGARQGLERLCKTSSKSPDFEEEASPKSANFEEEASPKSGNFVEKTSPKSGQFGEVDMSATSNFYKFIFAIALE